MFQYLGAWSFGPFAIVLTFGLIFSALYLPETHDRTVEEVHREVRSSSIGSTEGRAEEPNVISAMSAPKSHAKVCFNKVKTVDGSRNLAIPEQESPGKKYDSIFINIALIRFPVKMSCSEKGVHANKLNHSYRLH